MTCDSDLKMAAACGVYCGDCSCYESVCPGCPAVAGKVFWTKLETVEFDSCPIYDCCITDKGYEHCGDCAEFPCEVYMNVKDPDDPQADIHKEKIIRDLRRRTEIGTCSWLAEKGRAS